MVLNRGDMAQGAIVKRSFHLIKRRKISTLSTELERSQILKQKSTKTHKTLEDVNGLFSSTLKNLMYVKPPESISSLILDS